MTTDNALIQEIESKLGARGTAAINSDNRGDVRRWLCAYGVPSKTARTLTLAQLRTAYNDLTDVALSDLKTDDGQTATPPTERQTQQEQEPVTQQQTAAPQNADGRAAAISAAIAQALAGLDNPAPAIDEEQLIKLIRKHAPATRIEIKKADAVRTVDGLHHFATKHVAQYLSAGIHVWLAGPAGSGKTTIAQTSAKILDRPFYSTGAVQSEYKLTGFVDANGAAVRTPFREAYEHGGVFLWDEIDGSNPAALIAFNQALANENFAFPDGMVDRHPDFVAVAAGNTWGTGATAEYVGRNRIDAATLDRFMQLHIDYDEALERALVGNDYSDWAHEVQRYRERARKAGVRCIISTRAVISGAKLLAIGTDKREVLAGLIRRGMDDATWTKVKGA